MNNVYGDAGYFCIPNVGLEVPLYNKGKLKSAQSLVDKENSAVLCKKWKNGHCDYVVDHAGQGFDKIKKCTIEMPAFIVTEDSTQYYSCVGILKGINTKQDLITSSGQSLPKIKWADLCAYCCDDMFERNITMVFFKKGVKVDRNIFKRRVAQDTNAEVEVKKEENVVVWE